MAVASIKTVWSGGPSAPGLTIFNVRYDGTAIDSALTAVREFWIDNQALIPSAYTMRVQQMADLYDETTGLLTGSVTAAAEPGPVAGSMLTGWAAGVGYRIDWATNEIKGGRRVKGRTFIVPADASLFDTDGTLKSASGTALAGYAATLRDALIAAGKPLVVWSKPSLKNPVGSIHDVFGGAVIDKPAVLRGRRD